VSNDIYVVEIISDWN